jgi:hypothetical protein
VFYVIAPRVANYFEDSHASLPLIVPNTVLDHPVGGGDKSASVNSSLTTIVTTDAAGFNPNFNFSLTGTTFGVNDEFQVDSHGRSAVSWESDGKD